MLEFKTVNSLVRSARVAVLLDNADEDWQDTVLRTTEWCSQHWGGRLFHPDSDRRKQHRSALLVDTRGLRR